MTNEAAIRHILNDWHLTKSGKLIVNSDKAAAFKEAIGMGAGALQRLKNYQTCSTCVWIGEFGFCTCNESKYNRFLMQPEDRCDQWEEA